MSEALKRVQADVIVAMKAKDRTRVDVLRQFVNKIQMVAKNDGNREVADADVITAGLKTVKEANETRDIYVEKGISTELQDTEIAIVSEYLPKQMDEPSLRALIKLLAPMAPKGKSAKGYYMKELNSEFKGEFDNKMAQTIIDEIV